MTTPRERILIVEDHDFRYLLRELVQGLGYQVVAVANAREAFHALETFMPLLTILEWDLADGSGLGLSQRLRTWSSDHFIKMGIIMFSRRDEPDHFFASETYDAYVRKTDPIGALKRKLLELVPLVN